MAILSQCTYRCVVLPRQARAYRRHLLAVLSQCTYRCVVLPDQPTCDILTRLLGVSQCTYRCVVLPDSSLSRSSPPGRQCLNAPTGAWCSLTKGNEPGMVAGVMSQCTYRCVVLPDSPPLRPVGRPAGSQCTYRCVVLPDPCLREWRYDATSRARSATGPGSTPADRPAPGSD